MYFKRHTKWTRETGYKLAPRLAFEEDGQAPTDALRNFKPCYTAAPMDSSHRGRWEISRPINLSFGVRKANCLFGSGVQKLRFSPPTLPDSLPQSSCAYSLLPLFLDEEVLILCAAMLHQVFHPGALGLFRIYCPTPFPHQHALLWFPVLSACPHLKISLPEMGKHGEVTDTWK